MPFAPQPKSQFEELFSIDYRGLAVFRVFVAFVAIWIALFQMHGPTTNGGEWILVLAGGVLLLVGRLTALASLMIWVFLCRYLAAGNGDIGTYLTIVASMWCVFLPTDRCLVLGNVGKPKSKPEREPKAKAYASVATMAVLIQVFFVYVSAGLTKDMNEWLFSATAIRDLTHTGYVSPLGRTLLSASWVQSLLSVITIAVEVAVPFLMFVPGNRQVVYRMLGVLVVVGMHVGMLLTMTLETIPVICIGFWILFIPSQAWDRIWNFPAGLLSHTEDQRLCNWLAAPLFAVMLLSAGLSWTWPSDSTGTLERCHESVPKVGLYQQWRMFNTPSYLRSQAEEEKNSLS